MAAANPRASTHRLAIASCALGMLTYVGIKSLASGPDAAARQALNDRPQQASAAEESSAPAGVRPR